MENIIIAAVFIAVAVLAGREISRRAIRNIAYPAPPVDECLAAQIIGRPATYRGVKRNEPCPCGSGKKFKLCHLAGRE